MRQDDATNDPKGLDFTALEAVKFRNCEDFKCPYSRGRCAMMRWALGFALSLCVFMTVILSFGFVKTIRFFLSLS